MDERFDETEHGERFGVCERLAARGDHCRAGDALETRIRVPRTDAPDEPGTQQVTGRLTSNQANTQGRRP
jgi:hypothetical protein